MAFTASQVAALTETKLRTIQLWADFGILIPAKGSQGAGTGTHRQFDLPEVQVAALMAAFAGVGVPRGTLLRLANKFRDDLLHRSAVRRAVAGQGSNFLYYIVADTAVFMRLITDEKGEPILDLRDGKKMAGPLVNFKRTHQGIIDLNVAMKGLAE